MSRKEVFQVRCSLEEKDAWRRLAELKHMALSEYTRAVLNAMVEKERGDGDR
jgi:hypothetical protein